MEMNPLQQSQANTLLEQFVDMAPLHLPPAYHHQTQASLRPRWRCRHCDALAIVPPKIQHTDSCIITRTKIFLQSLQK
jgi:hypothetical protein